MREKTDVIEFWRPHRNVASLGAEDAVVQVDGAFLDLLFNVPVEVGPNHSNSDFYLDVDTEQVLIQYFGGSGTSTLTFSIATIVVQNAVCLLTYTQPENGLKSSNGDVRSFSELAVLNDSTQI